MNQVPVRIALVMPIKNGVQFLDTALKSVNQQQCDAEVEVLVADGGSDDGSLEILNTSPAVRIVSTSDSDLYDGLNKAISACDADLVGFLNSDDELPPGALQSVASAATANTDVSWFSGDVRFVTGEVVSARKFHTAPLTVRGAVMGIPAINSRFFRREALDMLGAFDQDDGIAADRGMTIKMASSDLFGMYLGQETYSYRSHSGSLTMSGDNAGRIRVWNAEKLLARRLLEQPDPSIRRDLLHSLNVTELKMLVSGLEGQMPLQWLDMFGSIYRWICWRGRLSGY